MTRHQTITAALNSQPTRVAVAALALLFCGGSSWQWLEDKPFRHLALDPEFRACFGKSDTALCALVNSLVCGRTGLARFCDAYHRTETFEVTRVSDAEAEAVVQEKVVHTNDLYRDGYYRVQVRTITAEIAAELRSVLPYVEAGDAVIDVHAALCHRDNCAGPPQTLSASHDVSISWREFWKRMPDGRWYEYNYYTENGDFECHYMLPAHCKVECAPDLPRRCTVSGCDRTVVDQCSNGSVVLEKDWEPILRALDGWED